MKRTSAYVLAALFGLGAPAGAPARAAEFPLKAPPPLRRRGPDRLLLSGRTLDQK
jgi:hypothetical protein